MNEYFFYNNYPQLDGFKDPGKIRVVMTGLSMSVFDQNILRRGGESWLAGLPERVDALAAKWGLKTLAPLENLSFHYVLAGEQNHRPIILKLGFDAETLEYEACALRAFQGYGVVELLNQDKTQKALLLRRIVPGYSLKSLFPTRDEEAVQVASQIMQNLHRAPIPTHAAFPRIADWLMALDRASALPSHHLVKARALSRILLQTSTESVILHGDLHHENLLFDEEQGWLAIDPKGVIGESAYEVGAFIHNPLPDILSDPNCATLIQKRVAFFAELLGISCERILMWCYVQSVLSACWRLEDQLDPQSALEITEHLGGMVH